MSMLRNSGRQLAYGSTESFLPKDNESRHEMTELLSKMNSNPEAWATKLRKGWGGVNSKPSKMARFIAPMLESMLLKEDDPDDDAEINNVVVPNGCISFLEGMKQSQLMQKEARAIDTLNRLEMKANDKLSLQKRILIDLMESCTSCISRLDKDQSGFQEHLADAKLESQELTERISWLDDVMSTQAQFLLKKHTGIDLFEHSDDDDDDNPGSQVTRKRYKPPPAVAATDSIQNYMKYYLRDKKQRELSQKSPTPALGIFCNLNEEGHQIANTDNIRSIKSPRSSEDPYYSMWFQLCRIANIKYFPDSVKQLIMVPDIDDDDNSSWWQRFQIFWQEQKSLMHLCEERDNKSANHFLMHWKKLNIDSILGLEDALEVRVDGKRLLTPSSSSSSSPNLASTDNSDSDLENRTTTMSDLFDQTYVGIGELTNTEMDDMIHKLNVKLKNHCDSGSLDDPATNFVREFFDMSHQQRDHHGPIVLPPLDILMADPVQVTSSVSDVTMTMVNELPPPPIIPTAPVILLPTGLESVTKKTSNIRKTKQKKSLVEELTDLVKSKKIQLGDAHAIRLILDHADKMMQLKRIKSKSILYKRKCWALNRCWALINFLCSSGNAEYQRGGSMHAVGIRYELVRSILIRHFKSEDINTLLSSAGTGKEDEVIYSNTIHEGSWAADFPIVGLQQVQQRGQAINTEKMSKFGSSTWGGVQSIEVEAPWDYTVGGWLCIRCMCKLRQRSGNCKCRCFRGHARRQCMGPVSECSGFHPNRLMEFLSLGLPTRYNTERGANNTYFTRKWSGRQRWRRWRMCLKDIVLNGDPWFGVVPELKKMTSFSGTSSSIGAVVEDWLVKIDWNRYTMWDPKRCRHNIFVMNVARLDMLAGAGSWKQQQNQPRIASNRVKIVWSRISPRCAMCSQDMIVNKNNTSRGLCVGCRSWKKMTNVETYLTGNIAEYKVFNTKAPGITDLDQDCIRQYFHGDSQFLGSRPRLCPIAAAEGFAKPLFSVDGLLHHVKQRMNALLYPEQDDFNQHLSPQSHDVAAIDASIDGHWHDGIFYPHEKKETDSVTADKTDIIDLGFIETSSSPSNSGLNASMFDEDGISLLPTQEEQNDMLYDIWDKVRVEICCWSEESFQKFLKTAHWDKASILLSTEWRRVWHGVINQIKDIEKINVFRTKLTNIFGFSRSSPMDCFNLPKQVIPNCSLGLFDVLYQSKYKTNSDISFFITQKEVILMHDRDTKRYESLTGVKRLMQWWPAPVLMMAERWVEWEKNMRLFYRVRQNFQKRTISISSSSSSRYESKLSSSAPALATRINKKTSPPSSSLHKKQRLRHRRRQNAMISIKSLGKTKQPQFLMSNYVKMKQRKDIKGRSGSSKVLWGFNTRTPVTLIVDEDDEDEDEFKTTPPPPPIIKKEKKRKRNYRSLACSKVSWGF